VQLIDKQREIAILLPQSLRNVPELDYWESAGKLAAILGERTDARQAIDFCLYEGELVSAAEIAALLGDVQLTAVIVAKYCEVTKVGSYLQSSDVGFVIGTIAQHHLQAAEKMWMMFAEKFVDYRPAIARRVLKRLVSPWALPQAHTDVLSTSTDPWTSLTQSVRSLSGSFEKLTVATEECTQAIRSDRPPPLLN
jgi:hypothetical protein